MTTMLQRFLKTIQPGQTSMKKQTNIRLPDSTTEQLDQLAEALGMTKTQVLILAIRALHEAEKRKGTFK